jgi:hypothetical protein
MDIGAFAKGKGKGGKGDDKKRGNCGKAGHFKKVCWAPGGGASSATADAGKGYAKSKGKGKGGKSSGKQAAGQAKTCWNCGKIGHMSKDCRSKALNWVEGDDDGQTPGAPGSGVSTASTMPVQMLSSVYLNSFQNLDDENEYDSYLEEELAPA